jgi:hypothetical protein
MVYVKEKLRIYKEENAMKKQITPHQVTEAFREYLKENNKEIIATYYGFSPYEEIGSGNDVTYYEENNYDNDRK